MGGAEYLHISATDVIEMIHRSDEGPQSALFVRHIIQKYGDIVTRSQNKEAKAELARYQALFEIVTS